MQKFSDSPSSFSRPLQHKLLTYKGQKYRWTSGWEYVWEAELFWMSCPSCLFLCDLRIWICRCRARDVWISSRGRSFVWTVTWSTLLIGIYFWSFGWGSSQLLCTKQKTEVTGISLLDAVFCPRLSERWLIRMCQHRRALIRALHRPYGRQSKKPPVANAFKNFPRI